MKKLLFFAALFMAAISTFAQVHDTLIGPHNPHPGTLQGWDTNIPQGCFCCGGNIYSLPSPVPINGPTSLACDAQGRYSTFSCPGATITWSISPAIPFTGQGTSTIQINPPYNASLYTITVRIRCGEKIVSNNIKVTIIKCLPDFMVKVEEVNVANCRVDIISQATTSGYIHFWFLQEVASCPNGALGASSWLAYTSATGTPIFTSPGVTRAHTAFGFSFSGLIKGKCYRLDHYVLCCGEWKVMSKCFCLSSTLKVMSEKDLKVNSSMKVVKEENLPKKVREVLKGRNNQ